MRDSLVGRCTPDPGQGIAGIPERVKKPIRFRGEESLLYDLTRDVRAFSVKESDARGYCKLVDGTGEVTDIQTESRLWLVAIFG